MKIAFVYDTVYPWVTGGAERRIYEIGRRLVQLGDEVHIYSLGFWKKDPKFSNKDIITYDGMTLHSVSDPMPLYTQNNKRSIKEALHFARSLLKIDFSDFDIIDVQGFPYFSCYTSRLKRGDVKLLITLHEVWNDYWYEYMGRIGFIGKQIERGIMYLTDNFICVSDSTYQNMLEIHEPANYSIIENGVNLNDIRNSEKSDEESDVIYAGRLIPEKHVDLLINAIAVSKRTHEDIKCIIVGEGPMKDDLVKQVKNLNLEDNIIFKGFLDDQKDLYSLFKSSKIFVLPSLREGFGIVVIEANASGIPVITIDNPMNAATKLIKESNGLISEDDALILSDKINMILDNDLFIEDDCISFATNYDWNIITKKTKEFYKKILDK